MMMMMMMEVIQFFVVLCGVVVGPFSLLLSRVFDVANFHHSCV